MDRLVSFGTCAMNIVESAGGGSGNGITVPAFTYQTITDLVPSGAIWWNPTSGSDSNNGSTKALAKKTFAAAQAAISTGGTIILVGGKHTVDQTQVFTKSGVSGNRNKLFAEPGTEAVLYREGEFKGAAERTWTWTLIDAGRKIWESPNIGIPDGATVISVGGSGQGQVSNGLAGFMRIPSGAHGRPHLMRLMWYGGGNYAPNSFTHANTGANAGRFIQNGGYGGPGFFLPGNGKVRVRMQKVTAPYSGTQWPTDGRMGTCIGSNGVWQEPISEDPNDYEFHMARFTGDFGVDGSTLFDMSGQSWWHLKGINGALMNKVIDFTTGSANNLFEKCTWYPQWCGFNFQGTTQNNRFLRCKVLTADNRSISWREHKTSNLWFQHGRSSMLVYNGANSTCMKDLRFEHCTFFGWFDMALSFAGGVSSVNTTVVLDHCCILNVGDDGFAQRRTDEPITYDAYYCYVAGGPCWSAEGNNGANGKHSFWHHCVIDLRIPMLWTPLGEVGAKRGVAGNFNFPVHSGGGTGPVVVRKLYYCTFIQMPDCTDENVLIVTPSPAGHNVPSGLAHEVFNNIFCVIDNKRYTDGARGDQVGFRLSCQQSTAGTHRYDYNCWHRNVPNASDPFFRDIQDSRNVNRTGNYASLAAFRASAHKTTSHSMYNDGTTGHEQHGVQVDPGFVNLNARDYRPTHASVMTGAKNLTGTGWPGTDSFDNWKGACDPNGTGSEIGPQNA